MKRGGSPKSGGRRPRAVSRGGAGKSRRPSPAASDSFAATSGRPGGGGGTVAAYSDEGPRADPTTQRDAAQRESSAEVSENACQCAASITTSYDPRGGRHQGLRLSKCKIDKFGNPSATRTCRAASSRST